MPHYRCIVANQKGKKTDVIKEASSPRELAISFSDSGFFLLSYQVIEEAELLKTKKHYKRDTVLEFTEVMSALLKAGLTIQDALELCKSISTNEKVNQLSQALLKELTRGVPFHQALKVYSSSFSPLYRALIRLGEQTGSVINAFDRMAFYLGMQKKLQGKIGNALIYPVIIFVLAFLGCFGIILFVMPRMTEIFQAFNTGDNQINLEIDRIYRSLWISLSFFLVCFGLAIATIILRKKSPSFVLFSDQLALKTPFLGPFLKTMETLDFAFAMEMLTGAGITISNALKESASVAKNKSFSNAVLGVYAKLLNGEKLSTAFAAYSQFPLYVGTWIAVGEKTGSVEQTFSQIRSYFQGDLDHTSEKIMSLIEPGMILLVGIVVLILIIQFVLPVFSLYGRML